MYKDILLPVDLEDAAGSGRALGVAVEYARSFDSVLHVMTVVPDFGMSLVGTYFPDGFAEKALEDADRRLRAYASQNMSDDVTVRHLVAHGRVYDEIIKAADSAGADLIVISAHRPDVSDYLLGSNAARVARHAKQSVLIVR